MPAGFDERFTDDARMKPTLRARAFSVLFAAMCFTNAHAAQNGNAKQKEFDDLIARVKRSDESVDFQQLRVLATQLETYSAYGSSDSSKLFTALNSGDFKEALKIADKVLSDNYLDVDAHFVAMIAADKLGESSRAAHHKYVAKGILDSIFKSGDGKTAATAFKVIAVSEEYALVRVLGLQVQGQSLQHAEGHSYDILKTVDPQTKSERSIYFNIDPIWAAETKLFKN
jgi:Domain of unknown function (DUF4919)